MKWEIKSKEKTKDVIETLLKNRGLTTKKEIDEFLHPKDPSKVLPEEVDINVSQLKKAITRIKKAINNNESIVVYGDYDADGVCATAVMWETLYEMKANVMPYIPHRIEEGYGFSISGIDKVIKEYDPKLIITVDHGITGNKKIDYAKKRGIDVIITDHHVKPKKLPKAYAIIHTTKLCAAGISWLVVKELKDNSPRIKEKLDVVAIATIADMVPLIGTNRVLVKYGLKLLNDPKRPGLEEIIKEAGLVKGEIGTYEVGHIIAPRLNATGRLNHAVDSLRLLCTNNRARAKELAAKLGMTNRERQDLTTKTTLHARSLVKKEKKIIFVYHETYNQGVIGLVAGKLVEEFYRPAIVISRGETISKASARSVSGFNIIEAIHQMDDLLTDAGGHPMAAGFTIETEKLSLMEKRIEELAERELTKETLTKMIKIDTEIDLKDLTLKLYESLQELEPFGFGNPEPTFMSQNVLVKDVRLVGKEANHLRLWLEQLQKGELGLSPQFSAIGFRMGEFAKIIHPGDNISVSFTVALDTWNGNRKLQLKLKDLKTE